MGDNDVFRVYNVKVKGHNNQLEERKSIDAESLLQWLDMKESIASVMTVDIDKLPDGKGVDYLQAKVATSSWHELKLLIQDMLGLLQQDDPEPEPVVNEEPTNTVSSVTKKPVQQAQYQPQQQKKQPSRQDMFDPEDNAFDDSTNFNDDEIIL